MNATGSFVKKFSKSQAMVVASAALFTLVVALLTLLPSNTMQSAGAAPQTESKGQDNPAQPQDCGLVWRVVSSPNSSGNDFLTKLYIVSPTDIWAAGNYNRMATGDYPHLRFRSELPIIGARSCLGGYDCQEVKGK